MDDLQKLHSIYRLKEVLRVSEAGGRRESDADHIWSSMMLAECLAPKVAPPLDMLKVHRLLLFHELVEIHAGDTFVLADHTDQREREHAAFLKMKDELPEAMRDDYEKLWDEYNNKLSREARFCWAMDKLDPMMQNLHDKEIWQRYRFTEEKLRASKESYFIEFPSILESFNELISYMRENGYFQQ